MFNLSVVGLRFRFRFERSARRVARIVFVPVVACWMGLPITHVLAEDMPNVLFIFSDQHRMATYPGEPHTSVVAPHMKQLAEEGCVFTNSIANYPVCSPSRAMLMSGRAPFQTGVVDNRIRLRDDGNSFGDVYKRAGYATGYIGKWHLGEREGPTPGLYGFDHFEPWLGTGNHRRSRYWDETRGVYAQSRAYNATTMTDHALDFIEQQGESPFLLFVSMNPPHSNYFDAPEEFKKLYEGVDLEERPNVGAVDDRYLPWFPESYTLEDTHRGYLAHVSAIDHEIGRMLDLLDELGIAENTIVVYSSDHGEMMGSHGRVAKRQPFEESIRIPFVVRWPDHVAKGMRTDVPIGVIDFLPTLCGLSGVQAPEGLDGRDLSGVLTGKPVAEPAFQPIMHVFRDLAGMPNHPAEIFRGVRTKRFTYAAKVDGPWLLFDLEKDPFQLTNVIGQPEYRSHLEELHAQTAQWLRDWDDPFKLPPLPEPSAGSAGL